MKYRRGDIHWLEIMGNRPAIIVSSDELNDRKDTVEVVILTTHPWEDLPTHCTIRSSPQTSTAICEEIRSVKKEQVRTYCGTCTAQEMATVESCIAIAIDLDLEDCEVGPEMAAMDSAIDDLKQKLEEKNRRIEELEQESGWNQDDEEARDYIEAMQIKIEDLEKQLEEAKNRETIVREIYEGLLFRS